MRIVKEEYTVENLYLVLVRILCDPAQPRFHHVVAVQELLLSRGLQPDLHHSSHLYSTVAHPHPDNFPGSGCEIYLEKTDPEPKY
jgi:hypothetical protein